MRKSVNNEVRKDFRLFRLMNMQTKQQKLLNCSSLIQKLPVTTYLPSLVALSPWTGLPECPTNVCINCPPGGVKKALDGISVGSGGLRESWNSLESKYLKLENVMSRPGLQYIWRPPGRLNPRQMTPPKNTVVITAGLFQSRLTLSQELKSTKVFIFLV